MNGNGRILYCHCAYARIVPQEVKTEVLDRLSASGAEFEAVADLCEMSARRDPRLAELAANSNLKIAACFPRAVRGLFTAAGAPLPDGAEILNMRTEPAEQIVRTILPAEEKPERPKPEFSSLGTWKAWFPVIDYTRCTNCMQCLSFCLFDVYGVSPEGKIQVRNNENCKTDCPACSRVCPEVAIMFPKYRHSPINGEEIKEDDLRREAMKIDISALLGGDIYSMLRDRSVKAKSRFSKERDDERALKERQNCLLKLQKDLDIPPEVLASLPSLDEIRAKAEKKLGEARRAD